MEAGQMDLRGDMTLGGGALQPRDCRRRASRNAIAFEVTTTNPELGFCEPSPGGSPIKPEGANSVPLLREPSSAPQGGTR